MMALWLAVISSALNQLPCVGHIRPGPAWAWWLLADMTESIAAVSAFVSHPPVLLGPGRQQHPHGWPCGLAFSIQHQ